MNGLHRQRRRLLIAAAAAGAAGAAGALGAADATATDRTGDGANDHTRDAALAAAADAFAFALIGDLPYNALEVLVLGTVFDAFDADLDFALHVGDIKASWESCSDALLDRRIALLESAPIPLVYVPGDNEWSDCAGIRAGRFDPRERLAWLRRRVFGDRAETRSANSTGEIGSAKVRTAPAGRRRPFAAVERQDERFEGGLPENRRWVHHRVRFVTLNLPGGNNGLNADGLERSDWERRSRANAQWLLDTYRLADAEAAAAVVVVAHANPHFGARSRWSIDGYAAFRSLLLNASNGFRGPTLFVHGDTHRHRVEHITPKLLRVESYGSPFSDRWVRIDVEPGAREPFRVTTHIARTARSEG